jgi:RNA polymerase sigma-70 factor (family 1)
LPDNTLYNERELLRSIAEGDERAFFTFYNHYSLHLRPFLSKYTRSATDVEEVIQETFIKIWLNRDSLEQVEQPKAWVFTIASRTYHDYLKKTTREKRRVLNAYKLETLVETITPFERASLAEMNLAVQQAVAALSEQKRKVFVMSRERGMKPTEIAQDIGIPVGTVKNQLSAALKDIREHLIAAGHGPILILYILIKII